MLKVIDNYKATIVGNYAETAATITLSVAPTVITEGYLTVFDFNGDQYEKIKFTGVSTNDITGCLRGLSFTTNSDSEITASKKELKNGMTVKLSVSQNYINDIVDVLKGTTASDGVMKNPAARVISDSRELVDKEYADAISTAGITSMVVTDNGGITVNIGSGYYILNGTVTEYAGASAEALTDDTVNYVQLVDGALDINVVAFDDDAIPLAKVTTASGDITVLEDARTFYTGVDIRTDVAGYLTGGTAATSVAATWAAVSDGSFRVTVDNVAYNVDAIDFTGNADMDAVAATIQVALRAATSSTETVVWDTDHFVITSATTGTTSEISVLETSTGTVGTDISGVGGTTFMDGETGVGTATAGIWSGIIRDSDGLYLGLNSTSGIEVVDEIIQAKIKASGGLVRDADGLSVDTSLIQDIPTMPAYESLVATDLLKVINDSSTYKLKKIVGIGDNIQQTLGLAPDTAYALDFCFIDDDKIAMAVVAGSGLYTIIGTISGTTLTVGTHYNFGTHSIATAGTRGHKVLKTATDSFVVVYGYTNGSNVATCYAIAATVSGTVVSFGSEAALGTEATSVRPVVDMAEIDTGKFVAIWQKQNGYINSKCFTVSGSAITAGSIVDLGGSSSSSDGQVTKLAAGAFVITWKVGTPTYHYNVGTVSGTTITYSGATLMFNANLTYAGFVRVSDNVLIFAYALNASTTLYLNYVTRAAGVLTIVGTTSFTSAISITYWAKGKLVLHSGFVYLFDSDPKLMKFSYDSTGGFTLVSSTTTIGQTTIYGTLALLYSDSNKILLWTASASATITFKKVLLDYDEFVTCANDTYSADDEVPLARTFTGFSSLKEGVDYYINSGASGLTVASTYQKVGKARNATTITKN